MQIMNDVLKYFTSMHESLVTDTGELLNSMTEMINKNLTDIRVVLYLIWFTKAYSKIGYGSFKSYIAKELTITYHAAIKQVLSAHYANELFGHEKIGHFSDNSMLTLGRLAFQFQIKVIHVIAKAKGKKPSELTKSDLTKAEIDNVVEQLSSRKKFAEWKNQCLVTKDEQEAHQLGKRFELNEDQMVLKSSSDVKDQNGKCIWDDDYDPDYDYLAAIDDPELLWDEIGARSSLEKLLAHVRRHKPKYFEYAMVLSEQNPHGIFDYVYKIYRAELPSPEDPIAHNVYMDDETENEDGFYDLDDLESNYPGPKSAKDKEQYIADRRKLIGKLQSLTDTSDTVEHPKLALMKAFFEILDHEDITYIYAKSSMLLNQDDDDEPEESADDDEYNFEDEEE